MSILVRELFDRALLAQWQVLVQWIELSLVVSEVTGVVLARFFVLFWEMRPFPLHGSIRRVWYWDERRGQGWRLQKTDCLIFDET